MDALAGDIRVIAAVVVVTFAYAWYEIYRMRARARQSLGPDRRSIIGILVALGIFAIVIAFLIPWQEQDARKKSDALQQQLEEERDRARELDGGDVDIYQ